jgi:hypothetical protein
MATALAAAAPTLLPRPHPAHPPAMAFVDAHYLQRAVCQSIGTNPHDKRLDVAAVRDWLLDGWADVLAPGACRRVYWYDGAYSAGHPSAEGQQRFLHAIGRLDLIHARLGHLVDITPDWQRTVRAALIAIGVDLDDFEERCPLVPMRRQKGVDITLALDLVRLAERCALSHALLLAGDSDFAPAIEFARDAGVLVTVISPERNKPAARLSELADQTIEMPAIAARKMLRTRDLTEPQPLSEAATEEEPAHTRPKPTRRSTRCGNPDRPALRAINGARARPAPIRSTRAAGLAPALPDPSAASAAVSRFTPFTDEDRAGLRIESDAGTARLSLVPSADGNHVAVRLESYDGEVTLATHDARLLVGPRGT